MKTPANLQKYNKIIIISEYIDYTIFINKMFICIKNIFIIQNIVYDYGRSRFILRVYLKIIIDIIF